VSAFLYWRKKFDVATVLLLNMMVAGFTSQWTFHLLGSFYTDIMQTVLLCNHVYYRIISGEGESKMKMDENFFTAYRKTQLGPTEVLLSIDIPFSAEVCCTYLAVRKSCSCLYCLKVSLCQYGELRVIARKIVLCCQLTFDKPVWKSAK